MFDEDPAPNDCESPPIGIIPGVSLVFVPVTIAGLTSGYVVAGVGFLTGSSSEQAGVAK